MLTKCETNCLNVCETMQPIFKFARILFKNMQWKDKKDQDIATTILWMCFHCRNHFWDSVRVLGQNLPPKIALIKRKGFFERWSFVVRRGQTSLFGSSPAIYFSNLILCRWYFLSTLNFITGFVYFCLWTTLAAYAEKSMLYRAYFQARW